jgi:hypothetical protein
LIYNIKACLNGEKRRRKRNVERKYVFSPFWLKRNGRKKWPEKRWGRRVFFGPQNGREKLWLGGF